MYDRVRAVAVGIDVAVPLDPEEKRKTDKHGFTPHPEVDTGFSQQPEDLWLDEMVHPEGARPDGDLWGFRQEARARDVARETREAAEHQRSRAFDISENEALGGSDDDKR